MNLESIHSGTKNAPRSSLENPPTPQQQHNPEVVQVLETAIPTCRYSNHNSSKHEDVSATTSESMLFTVVRRTHNIPRSIGFGVVLVLLGALVLYHLVELDLTTLPSITHTTESTVQQQQQQQQSPLQQQQQQQESEHQYEINQFVPLNNASTTFTLDDFQFILLHDQHQQPNTVEQHNTTTPWNISLLENNTVWTIPTSGNASAGHSFISPATMHSILTNPSSSTTTTASICQVICRFDRVSHAYKHFPHFLQQALPCYSMIHYIASSLSRQPQRNNTRKVYYYIMFPYHVESPTMFSSYIKSFVQVLAQSPYQLQIIYGFHKSIPVHTDCDHNRHEETTPDDTPSHQQAQLSSSSSSSIAIYAIKTFMDSGWSSPSRYFLSESTPTTNDDTVTSQRPPTSTTKTNQINSNPNYYNNYESIQQLQQYVLGNDQYRIGPSSTFDDVIFKANNNNRRKRKSYTTNASRKQGVVQILILDRKPLHVEQVKKGYRDFAHINDTIQTLQNYVYTHNFTNQDSRTMTRKTVQTYRMNVTYVPTFTGCTLYEQALYMHRADIIYSPHGAQLSNVLYIRPCTVLVEFFPWAYYLQFFQSLVVNARGISYEAYGTGITLLNGTNRVTETMMHGRIRSQLKGVSINVSSEFYTSTFPQLIHATIQCRMDYLY
jgi:Glycosyltransferase 61